MNANMFVEIQLRKLTLSALFIVWSSTTFAAPEGYWPIEAQGVSLPKPEWVLVIPAKRDSMGSIVIWDRDVPWMRQWIVPQSTPNGLRTIAIAGDSEDKRLIEGFHLDEMDTDALQRLASKYKAPAIAIAVSDESDAIAVAGWMPEQAAAWESVQISGSRKETLATIDLLFNGQNETSSEFDVAIVGQRQTGNGSEFKLLLESEQSLDLLYESEGIRVLEYDLESESPSAVITVTDGRHLETVLYSSGVRYR